MKLINGQKIVIPEDLLTIKMEFSSSKSIDVAVFLLDSNDKLISDNDLISKENTNHFSGAVVYDCVNSLRIELLRLPGNIKKISLTAFMNAAKRNERNFNAIREAKLRVFGEREEIAQLMLNKFTVEKAIVFGEIYRHNNSWKFNAIGAGFSNVETLFKSFGADPKLITNGKTQIELHWNQKINLVRTYHASEDIIIRFDYEHLNVIANLACLFELKDGSIGAIQALGNHLGSLNCTPYIALKRDYGLDSNSNDEKIILNKNRLSEIKRILVYTFIYDDVANWSDLRGALRVNCSSSCDIIVRVSGCNSMKQVCALAYLENINETIIIEKIQNFFDDLEQMDRAFNWNLQWFEEA